MFVPPSVTPALGIHRLLLVYLCTILQAVLCTLSGTQLFLYCSPLFFSFSFYFPGQTQAPPCTEYWHRILASLNSNASRPCISLLHGNHECGFPTRHKMHSWSPRTGKPALMMGSSISDRTFYPNHLGHGGRRLPGCSLQPPSHIATARTLYANIQIQQAYGTGSQPAPVNYHEQHNIQTPREPIQNPAQFGFIAGPKTGPGLTIGGMTGSHLMAIPFIFSSSLSAA